MIYEKQYNAVQSYECLNACITGYLNYYGYRIRGNDIFFAGEGFHLEMQNINKPVIEARLYESNFTFMKKSGIQFTFNQAETKEDAADFLERAVLLEKAVCIKVSSEQLEHNRVFRQTDHSPHYLNVLGISEKGIYIADGYVPTVRPESYQGFCCQRNIISAWEKMDFRYILFDFNGISLSVEEIGEMAQKKLVEGLENFIERDAGTKYLTALFHYLADVIKQNDCVRETFIAVNYQLKIYGFITYKRFVLERMICQGMNRVLVERYQMIIEKWNRMCLLLLKAGYSKSSIQLENTKNSMLKLMNEETKVLCSVWKLMCSAR